MKKTELQTMVVNELKALAKKMNVKMPSSARKAEIVELLSTAFKKKSMPSTTNNDLAAKNGSRKTEAKASSVQRGAESTRKRTITAKNGTVRREPAAIAAKAPSSKTIVPKPAIEVPGLSREWKMPPAVEEPLMAQERVSDAKYYTGPEQQAGVKAYGELPLGYGEEKIALMVRDPYLAYVYWEVTPSRVQREKAWFGWSSKLTVRIYDVTGVQFDGRNAAGYYDQEVSDLIGSWYFDLGRPTHSFISDIGLLSPEGRFLTLARSNYVMMPRDGVSDVVDEEWMLLDEEFWKLYGFPGGPSSPQLQEMIRIRRLQQISSPGAVSRERSKRK